MPSLDGFDWGASGRRDTYAFEAVDPFTLHKEDDLDAIPSECSVTYGRYTDNRAQASIVLADGEFRLNGHDRMVRIRHTVTLPGGHDFQETLGTFFVDSSQRKPRFGRTRNSLNCYSALWRLTQDSLAGEYIRKKGQTIYGGVESLITYPGGLVRADPLVSQTRTHTVDVRFKPGENRAEVLNTICGWANWTMGVDDDGYVTIEPQEEPSATASSAAYEFEAGRNCIYKPGYDVTRTDEVYNRVVAKWSREKLPSTSDGFGLSGTYIADLDASEEFSFSRCGRYMTYVLDVGEPCSDADLKSKAEQYLSSHSAAARYLEIEHANVPGLRAGDVVVYENTTDEEIRCFAEVTQMDIARLGPFCMCRSKLKVLGDAR